MAKNKILEFFKEKSSLCLGFAIGVLVILTLYFSRQIFFYKYEPEYQENLYYHSQWNIPQSTRGISDGTLYQFVGYQLVHGENPFNINYEVPPLGKYLYGLAERFIGNPYWVSVVFYIVSGFVLFLLARELSLNKIVSLAITLLFVSTPFVATQVRETMLDLPLMFMYLMHLLLFIRYLKSKKVCILICSGFFLGLASGVKIAVYTPFVFLFGLIFIFLVANKKIRALFIYPVSIFAGYVLSFFCYFIKHPNPIPWLRLHEKPINFYLSASSGKLDYLNQWRGIFLNVYEGWWQKGGITSLGDWSLILPIGVLLTFFFFFSALKKRNFFILYLSGLSIIFLGVNTVIPFFPRYLMSIVPIFILLIGCYLKKYIYLILLLVLCNIPFYYSSMVSNSPNGHINVVARFFSTAAYHELYRSIIFPEGNNVSEEIFTKKNESLLSAWDIRKIEVEVGNIVTSGSKAEADYQIKYLTKCGELTNNPRFRFIKVHNQWKLIWDWEYLYPDYGLEAKIVSGKCLEKSRKKRLIGVYIIPRLMFDWGKNLNALSFLTGLSSMEIDTQIKYFVPDKYKRFVGYLNKSLPQDQVDQALSFPGISLEKTE